MTMRVDTRTIILISLWVTGFPDINGQFCNPPYPSDWPQACINAFLAFATNDTYTNEDRQALKTFLTVTCPTCLDSFLDYNTLCVGGLTQSQADFWRRTYCLREDGYGQYCRIVMFDYIANTTLDDTYASDCADPLSRGVPCSPECQAVLQKTQDYLGCCASVFANQSVEIIPDHYDACGVKVNALCGSSALTTHTVDRFVVMIVLFFMLT